MRSPTERTWLELVTGETVPLSGTCAIGRARDNQLVLADEKVSRHHALIRMLDGHESWIVDLASANGTYVNQRRIDHSGRLQDGDEILLGSIRIVFRSAAPTKARDDTSPLDQTVHDVREFPAWLLLVDIVDSTGIGRRLGQQQMVHAFGEWLGRCRESLERSGGIIDKPLGDGFFAFWPAAHTGPEQMAWTILAFREFQGTSDLPFRMVLHHGITLTGGQMASGVYRLFGPEVNFTFHMEGLAKTLNLGCLLSEPAMRALGGHVTPTLAGSHTVHGLDRSLPFYHL